MVRFQTWSLYHVRPPEVNDRVIGALGSSDPRGAGNQSAVGVLVVERSTRLVLLCKMPDASADMVHGAFTTNCARSHSRCARRSPDQGREMARHKGTRPSPLACGCTFVIRTALGKRQL